MKRILSVVLVLVLIVSSINIFFINSSTSDNLKYEIAVAVDPDNTNIDLSTFENDLKTHIISQYATQHPGQSIIASAIDISYVKPNKITTNNQSNWKIYDNYYSPAYDSSSKTAQDQANLLTLAGRTGQPFYYYKEGVPTDANFYTTPDQGIDNVHFRDKHIYTQGSRVTFLGYSAPGYGDFILYPDTNKGTKTINYSIYLDSVNTHTLGGAGFLVNSSISGSGASAVINGYLIYYAYGNSNNKIGSETLSLYKLTNVNVDQLHAGTANLGTAVATGTIQVDGRSGIGTPVKDIKLKVSPKSIEFYEKNGTNSSDTYHLALSHNFGAASTVYGFGPYVSYLSHGCNILTLYTYDNLEMVSNVTKTFEEKILETKWHDGAVHALINVDDSGIVNFNDDNARTEMLQRLISKNVHYIGWGVDDKTQELSFIHANNGLGMYIDTATDEITLDDGDTTIAGVNTYDAQIEEIAKYLVGQLEPDINQMPVAKIAYNSGTLSSISTDPENDPLTESWSFKEADDADWTIATDAAEASTSIATILSSDDKNVLVQLLVTDDHSNASEPDVLYLSSQEDVKPIAEFAIDEYIDLETAGSTIVTPLNLSFDPYLPTRTMAYNWEVYDEMNNRVLSSSEFEPNLDFAGLSAGSYEIKLTTSVSSGVIVSNTFVQTIDLIDTVAPTLLVGLTGNSSNATANIEIIDNGSGPDSYRVISTNNSNITITGPWLQAKASNTITKTYTFTPTALKNLSFEVRDGSGNTETYPVDFSMPMIAFTPNGGDIYTNFTYDEDVRVDISSLTAATITGWYYEWSTGTTTPADITATGTHVTGAAFAYIPQPNEIGNYYLHVQAENSSHVVSTRVSQLFHVAVAQNGVRDLRVTSFDGAGVHLSWTQPRNATAQKILYSTDDGITWNQATYAPMDGTSSSALVTGLNRNNEYIFQLYVTGGDDAGESNLAYWKNLISYATGDNQSSVTENVTLAAIAGPGTTVSWSSSDTSVADRFGNIYRPTYNEGNKVVTLTAILTNGLNTCSISYQLNIMATAATDEESVAEDKTNVQIIYANGDNANSVTQNITLSAVTVPSYGSTVTWTSSDTDIISDSGVVARPAYGSGDAVVTITATITKNDASDTKVFTLKVKETPPNDEQALAALAIIYAPFDDETHVTRNVGLPVTASNDAAVVWSSSSSAIAIDGTVTRPQNGEGNASVNLTADINGEQRIYNLTVIEIPEDNLVADSALLDVIYAPGDTATSVTKNVTLVSSLPNGSTVTWSSDTPAVVDTNGTVVRPANGSGDATVTLDATITNGTTTTKQFILLVLESPVNTDAQDVQSDLDNIAIVYAPGDDADNVSQNIGLPLTGTSGSTVTWSASDGTLIDTEGNVYRPSIMEGDKQVILTATATKGATTQTRTFTLLVKAIGVLDESILNYEKSQLSIGYAPGDSENSVTQNVILPVSGSLVGTVVWSSDKPGVVSDTGAVTRPAAGSADSYVRLTAEITYNGVTVIKNFVIVVKAYAQVTPPPGNPPTPPANPTIEILVNGKSESAGTVTKTTQGAQTVTTVTLDEEKLNQKLSQEGQNAVVTIPVNNGSDVVVGELNGQMVKNMENLKAIVEVRTEDATYTLPAEQIDIDAVSRQIGTSVVLEDIKVQIEIRKSTDETVSIVESSAKAGEYSIVVPPIDFNIRCTYGNQTVDVSAFNAYVERMVAIPDGVDPNKITTGVVVDPNGVTRHIPTRITIINGRYYAVLNSLTNSTYTVVWHPITFSDVENHWSQTAANDMGSRMVMEGIGNGQFGPRQAITRGEFATIIVKALGLTPGMGHNAFSDVGSDHPFLSYIKTASAYNIIVGYGNGKFGPSDKITREQALTMIQRAMSVSGLKVAFDKGEVDQFANSYKDSSKVASYARTAMAACVKSGIVIGKEYNIMAPKDYITRAEVAIIIRNLLIKSNLINK